MASLVGTLNRANNELLHSLANAWGIDASGSDNRLLIRTILTKMLDRWHLRCKLEELGKAERQILFHLADSFDHWLTLSEVETYARLEGYDASQCVENLARSGLILVDDWQEFQKSLSPLRRLTRYPQPERGEPALALPAELVPEIEAVNDAMDQGDYSHYPVLAFLDATKARELQSVALRWNIPRPHSLSKQNLIQRLMEAITEGPGTWTASQWYSPQTTKVLGRIREKGGKAAVADLKSEFEAEELRQTYMDLNSAMMLEETYIDGRRFLFIPRDILAAMADEKALERTTLAPVQPSGEIDDSHLLLVEDLNTLMNFIIGNSIELTTASSIPQRTLTKLLALLVGEKDANPQSPRFTFVLDCAHRLGLVRGTGEKIVPGDSIDQWVQLSIAEQVKRIINVWLGSPRFEVPPGLDYFSSRISWPNARTRILKHLTANCKVGEWYYVQSLAELIVSSDRELLGGQATLGEMRRIGFLNKNELDKAILTFVINVLAFPLHWIGLVSLARMSAESTGSLCLSLTAMGGWALDAPDGAPPPEPSDKPLIVQP
ncbi:MAG: hypothetical protein Q7O66_04775, partial [Dehalococcoidia bacterium]|nr:hypothetical protein [Dehalococcoidia bacterium]